MISYPDIPPTIFKIGPVQVRWYGLMYIFGFFSGYWILRYLAQRRNMAFGKDRIVDFLSYAAIGVIGGGRIGYILFYNLGFYLQHPLKVFFLWEGGLSFHGGLIGVMIAGAFFCRRHGYAFYDIADIAVIPLPIGLGLGRIGNFINGELYGRPTDVPWCMVFPGGGPQCRHPSQLYESFLEGLLLFGILFWMGRKEWPKGVIFWSFLSLYGIFRFFVEFFRQPDQQLGLIVGPFSMGQCLSLPMALLGVYMIARKAANSSPQ
jgi:phosphatidylglycerol:prolipoprotein diacylglycerol transferase